MASVYTKKNPDGSLSYLDINSWDWKPLVHGETRLQNDAGENVLWDQTKGTFVPQSTLGDFAKQGMAAGYQALVRAGEQLGFYDEESAQKKMQETPVSVRYSLPSPEYTESASKSNEGILPAIGQMLANPSDFTLPIAAQSLPQMVVPLGAGVAGTLAGGPLLGTAAVGAASYGVNETSHYNEVLQQLAQAAGKNPSDPDFAVWANNPAVRAEATRRATAYAGPVAAIDALSMGLAGRTGQLIAGIERAGAASSETLARAARMGGRAAEAAALANRSIPGVLARGAAQQVLAGGVGETLGQMNESGRITDPASIAAEMVLEAPSGAAEIGSGYLFHQHPARTPLEKSVETRVQQVKEESVKTGKPLGEYLNSNDYTAVEEFLSKNNISPELASKLSTDDYVDLALKLKAQKEMARPADGSSIPNMYTPQLGEVSQADYQRSADYLIGKGLDPIYLSKLDKQTVIAQARKIVDDERRNQMLQSTSPRLLEGPKQTTDRLEKEAVNAFAAEAQIQEARKLARAGEAYLQQLGTSQKKIDKLTDQQLYEIGKKALRNPSFDKNFTARDAEFQELGYRKLAAPSPEELQKNAAYRKTNVVDAAGNEFKTEKTNFVAGSPKQNQDLQTGKFKPGRSSDIITKEVADKKEALAQAKQQRELAKRPSGLIRPSEQEIAHNPLTIGVTPTETEQTVGAAMDFRRALAEAMTSKKNPRKYSKIIDMPGRAEQNLNTLLSRPENAPDTGNIVNFSDTLAKRNKAADDKARFEYTENLKRTALNEADSLLKSVLKKYNLLNKVNPVVTLEMLAEKAGGYVEGKTLMLAALQPSGRTAINTINHEVVHILRNLGLFTPGEWQTLTKAASEGKWVERYLSDNPEYSDLTDEEKLEEAVAEHFAQTASLKTELVKSPEYGLISKLGRRVVNFFRALRNWVEDALGVTTPDEVLAIFDSIENGEIGSRQNDLADPFSQPRKYSKNMRDMFRKKRDESNADFLKALPDDVKQLSPELESGQTRIGKIAWWFRDLQQHAARIPSLRPLYRAAKNLEQTAHSIRVETIKTLVPLLKWSREDRKRFNRALAFLDRNNSPLPELRDNEGNYIKSLEITLNDDTDFLIGKKGDKIVIDGQMIEVLDKVHEEFKSLRQRYRVSAVADLVESIEESVGIHLRELGPEAISKGEIDYIQERVEESIAKSGSTPNLEKALVEIKAVSKALKDSEKDTRVFYIPKVRQSPLFFTIYDKSKPANAGKIGDRIKTTSAGNSVPYERVGVVNMPLAVFGRTPTKAQQEAFMQSIFEQSIKNNPNIFIDPTVVDLRNMKSAAEREVFLNDSQFDFFEKLSMVSELPGITQEEKKALIRSIREAWATVGYKVHERKSLKLPGFIHEDNMDNYIIAAGSVYADRAASAISRNVHGPDINKALSDIQLKARNRVLDNSVADYAADYINYIYSSNPEWSRVRNWAFNFFLGLNPSSAFLNNFQILHSSLPVLTAMYGSPADAALALSKYWGKNLLGGKNSFINYKEGLNPDPYKDLTDNDSIPIHHKNLITHLINRGVLRPHTIEEMQARDIAEQLAGASKESIESFKNFANSVNNASSYMFGRVEALTRVSTALAAYDLAKKATNNPAVKARLEKFLESTPYAGADPTNAYKMAEIAVELSHPDTTKFNRAKAFRGNLALPTQFMAFPVKMLDLYLSLLSGALGIKFSGDNFKMSMLNSDKNLKLAFSTLFLGLVFTSGLSGAIPFGEPLKDVRDKVTKILTGIDPDTATQIRESLMDLTGSPMLAEMLDKGFLRALAGVDVSQRMGVQMFQGVNTEANLLDLLGPSGAILGSLKDAHDRYEQGHTLLAASMLAPVAIRNLAKAYYANEYGLVTTKGNITPVNDLSPIDTFWQATGFTPTSVARVREAQYSRDRLSSRTSVAKERAMDMLTTLRVKSIIARQRGNAAESAEYVKKYQEYFRDLIKQNQQAEPKDRVTIDSAVISDRVLKQLQALRGQLYGRPLRPELRNEAANIETTYQIDDTNDAGS